MTLLQDTYLGWDELAHKPGCATPQWTIDVRTEPNAFRDRAATQPHGCPAAECGHGDRYEKTSVRIVCSSCGHARIMSGDSDGFRQTSTKALGYGQPPKKAGGLWLYPGEPLLFGWGHGEHEEPEGYVVTRTRVDRVTADNVIGTIHKARGPRRGVKWEATAVPDPSGQYGLGNPVRWAHASEGLATVAAAAKWIAGVSA
ncbi:hypothetical protein [uncultured Streptomyces sp.]|uniref:hypothetical protein n=1 Tax=uncultured Streptomyces sp. TaxID=174707 RepID=UPI002615B841|nr:hypothetical protein [uncultured Streptomyces sp.]